MKKILLTSSVLILALLLLRRLFRDKISRRVQYALWGLVLLRLLVPVNLPAISGNVLTAAAPVVEDMESLYVGIQSETLGRIDHTPVISYNQPPRVTVGPATEDNVQVSLDRFNTIHQTEYAQQINLADFLLPIWYGGMALMACWLILSNLLFWRKLRRARTLYPAEGCKYPVYLIENGLPSPCLFGLFRPAVYLTPAALASPDSLRHVLAHEETHARHLDPLWALLRGVCLTIYWFDPLVWWAAIVSRTDCELACDEGALRRLGEEERIPYGRTLLSLIPVRRTPVNPMLSATTMTAGKKQLKDRISRIAQNRKTVKAALAAVALLAAVICAVTFTGAKGAKEMTEAEVNEFMDSFFESDGETGFSPSLLENVLFSTPHEIDLYELFCLGTGLKNEQASEKELALVEEQLGEHDPDDFLVKISASQMDAYLTKYTGSPRSNHPVGLERFIYLPDYDAYYHYYDTSSPHGGRSYNYTGLREGDIVQIRYDGNMTINGQRASGRFCLTFKKIWNNQYFLYSHRLEGPDNNDRTLTAEELASFNKDFLTQPYKAQFLTSVYNNPDEIDLYQLCYNGTNILEKITEEERQRVINVGYGGVDPGVDLTKISYEHMTQFLENNTGFVGGYPGIGLEKFTWLGSYNAYYHFHGDTNAVQPTFTSGTRNGYLIRLYYDGSVFSGDDVLTGPFCLTLRERPAGGYWFVSNLPVEGLPTVYPDWEPELTIPLEDAQPYTAPTVEQKTYGGKYTEMLDGDNTGVDNYALCVMRTEHGNIYFGVQSMFLSSWPSQYFLMASNDTYSINHFRNLFGHDGLAITYTQDNGSHYRTDYYYFLEDGTPVLLVRTDCPENASFTVDLDGDGTKELATQGFNDVKIFFQRNGVIYEADLETYIKDAWPEAQYIHLGIWDTSGRYLGLSGEVPYKGTHDPTGNSTGTAFRYLYFDGENLRIYSDQRLYPNHFAEGIDAPADVREAAEHMVSGAIESQSEGWRLVDGDFVTMPVQYDDWRVSLLEGPYTETFCGQTFQVWRMDYQLHTDTPEYVIMAGGRYATDDGWVSSGYPGCDWLFFLLNEDGSRDYLYSAMENDCDPGSETFWLDQFSTLEELGLISLDQLDGAMLMNYFARNPPDFLNHLAEYPEAQQKTVTQSLGEFIAIVNTNEGSAYSAQWERVIDYLRDSGQDVTEEGKNLWNQLNSIAWKELSERPAESPDAPTGPDAPAGED